MDTTQTFNRSVDHFFPKLWYRKTYVPGFVYTHRQSFDRCLPYNTANKLCITRAEWILLMCKRDLQVLNTYVIGQTHITVNGVNVSCLSPFLADCWVSVLAIHGFTPALNAAIECRIMSVAIWNMIFHIEKGDPIPKRQPYGEHHLKRPRSHCHCCLPLPNRDQIREKKTILCSHYEKRRS